MRTATRVLPSALHAAGRSLLTMLMYLVPSRSLAVVHGRPYEENALRMALALPRHYAGRVVLLARDRATARGHLDVLGGTKGRPVDVVAVRSLMGVWLFLRAEYVFYTHGLYGSPKPARSRVHVNLWHGHGPKRTGEMLLAQNATFMVSNTRAWGSWAADSRRMMPDALLVVGNPRQDAFDEPPGRHCLERLDLDPGRPFLLWLPTHRAKGVKAAEAGDGTPSAAGVLDSAAEMVAAAAERANVTVLLKTHPLDATSFPTGLRQLRSDELFAAGLSLYSLMALSGGLLSDYSSVWVEYLELERPLGLVCPDLHIYEARGGFKSPDLRAVAGGLLVSTPEEMSTLVRNVRDGRDWRADQRRLCAQRLGVREAPRRIERLLQELNERATGTSPRPFRGVPTGPREPAPRRRTAGPNAQAGEWR